MAAVGGPEDSSVEERARNEIGGEGGRELVAAQSLEMHGVGEQEEEKSKEDGEIGSMPFIEDQKDESERAKQEGTFGYELLVDFRETSTFQLIEIFFPTGPHGWEGAVHADADESLAAAKPDGIAGAFDELGKSHIFEHFPGDTGMATDGIIGIAANQDELAVGGSSFVARIVDFVEGEISVEAAVDEGDERFFVPSVHYLFGRKGDQRCVRLIRDLQGVRGRILLVHCVSIGEEEPIARGLLRAEPHGVVFADPAWRRSGSFEQAHLGRLADKSTDDFGSAIGGLIVDHENFGDFGLLGQRFDTGGDDGFFVAGGDDGGNLGRIGSGFPHEGLEAARLSAGDSLRYYSYI